MLNINIFQNASLNSNNEAKWNQIPMDNSIEYNPRLLCPIIVPHKSVSYQETLKMETAFS